MRTIDIVAGITTLGMYREKQDGYDISAEHDEIHAAPTSKPLTDADVKKLLDLGWFQLVGADRDNPAAAYEPSEGWSCYV